MSRGIGNYTLSSLQKEIQQSRRAGTMSAVPAPKVAAFPTSVKPVKKGKKALPK